MLKQYLFILLASLPLLCPAEILPVEGSKLNFRLVGFSFPQENGVKGYTIEIAEGDYHTPGDFERNIVVRHSTNRNAVVLEVPAFGKAYTWRYRKKAKNDGQISLHHFSLSSDQRTDTSSLRLKIMKPSVSYTNQYIMLDGDAMIYDTEGMPIAYLPERGSGNIANRAMSVTPDSSIVFICGKSAIDMSLGGDVLWKAPDTASFLRGGAPFFYHHDVTRLRNGNYMVMGMEFANTKQVRTDDTAYLLFDEHAKMSDGYYNVPYSSMMEIDKWGRLVWSWREKDYFAATDFAFFEWPEETQPSSGLNRQIEVPQMAQKMGKNGPPPSPKSKFDAHANSFFFDEEDGIIYVCYRNLNRIVKVAYPAGDVIAEYGQTLRQGHVKPGSNLFCNPHSVKKSEKGYLYYFNNNTCREGNNVPHIVAFAEGKNGVGVTIVWDYEVDVTGGKVNIFPSGGYVEELPGGEFFICAGSDLGKVLIVDRDKRTLWASLPEVYDKPAKRWVSRGQYRAALVTRKQMEMLVWKAEKLMSL